MSETRPLHKRNRAKLSGEEKRVRDEMLVGQQVHHYRFEKLLGHGGWGRVYLALDTKSGRQVALKLLLPELLEHVEAGHGGKATERFEQEAQAAQCVCHPNLIQVLDYEEESELGPYLAMEYLVGDTLTGRLRHSRPLSQSTIVSIFGQVSEGLAALHQNGIVYRDLKPSNIYIVPIYGHQLVKLLDFGIALLPEAGRLTLKGQLLGTPLYMSPEQIFTPSEVTSRSDVYSFGVLFYRVLTGQSLFSEKNLAKLYKLHRLENKNLTHPKLRLQTQKVLARILSPKPEERPATITEAWQLLEASLMQAPFEAMTLEGFPASTIGVSQAYTHAGAEDDTPTVRDAEESTGSRSFEPLST